MAKLTGHSYRVLYLAMSPDGESIVTGAGDETLRLVLSSIYFIGSDRSSRSGHLRPSGIDGDSLF